MVSLHRMYSMQLRDHQTMQKLSLQRNVILKAFNKTLEAHYDTCITRLSPLSFVFIYLFIYFIFCDNFSLTWFHRLVESTTAPNYHTFRTETTEK